MTTPIPTPAPGAVPPVSPASAAGGDDPDGVTHLTGTATYVSWDEEPAWDGDAPVPRLAHATVAFRYEGDIEATSTCRYVLNYADRASGTCVGFERIDGTVAGEQCGVVLRHDGTFGAEGVDIRWTVEPGSGTGAMAGAAGRGGFTAPAHAQEWTWHLDRER